MDAANSLREALPFGFGDRPALEHVVGDDSDERNLLGKEFEQVTRRNTRMGWGGKPPAGPTPFNERGNRSDSVSPRASRTDEVGQLQKACSRTRESSNSRMDMGLPRLDCQQGQPATQLPGRVCLGRSSRSRIVVRLTRAPGD